MLRLLHLLPLLALALSGCGAAAIQTTPSDAPTSPAALSAEEANARAESLLRDAAKQAEATQSAVIVLLHAEWCQPCNELLYRVMETRDGRQIVGKHVLLSLDFDEPVGGAVAAKLRVLGLPTTLVLRPQSGGLTEMARVEGFEQPDAFRAALTQALARRQPVASGCDNADGRSLDLTRPVPLLLADLECLQMQLTTGKGVGAAAAIHGLLDDPAHLQSMATWPDEARGRLLAVVQALGRYDSRLARDHRKAAALFAAFVAWPGTRPDAVAGLVFWHARELAKAGDVAGAERVLDRYVAAENGSAQSRLLAADLLVTERIAPLRAKRLLDDYLAADATDHWALYLAGDLAAQLGNREEARARFQAANRLKPGVALYIRQYMRVSGDAVHQE